MIVVLRTQGVLLWVIPSKHVTSRHHGPFVVSQNFKVTMEMDDLQRRMAELCEINADLQVPLPSVRYHFYMQHCIITSLVILWLSTATPCILGALPFLLTKCPFHCICLSRMIRKCRCTGPCPCCYVTALLTLHRCRFTPLMPSLGKKKPWY